MNNFLEFGELILDECSSLIDICPPSVGVILGVAITFVIVLALWRTVVG